MESRDRVLLTFGIAAAGIATGLALWNSQGTVDTAGTPPIRTVVVPSRGSRAARGLPALALPPGFPAPARALLEEAHRALSGGTDEEAAAALHSLALPDPAGPLAPVAPGALEAVAPALEWLITEKSEEALAGPAMRAAAGLARCGGAEGRRAIERTGLVTKAFAFQGALGRPDLRQQAALLMGFVATDRAVECLVSYLDRAAEAEVREAAATGLREAFRVNGTLPSEALLSLRNALDARGAPPAVRRACLDAYRECWTLIAPYPGVVEGVLAALPDADPGTRLAAANVLFAHPVPRAGPAVLARIPAETDERIVEVLATVLSLLRPGPPGTAEALLTRLPSLKDPKAITAVNEAIRATGER